MKMRSPAEGGRQERKEPLTPLIKKGKRGGPSKKRYRGVSKKRTSLGWGGGNSPKTQKVKIKGKKARGGFNKQVVG